MFDSQELSLNTCTFSQSYISPPPAVSPLTLFDAHEIADLIRRAVPRTDVAEVAAYIETENISGRDFLNLSPADLQTLSKNNEQVFRELRKLQRIPHKAMTYVSARSPSIKRGFPELESLIHNSRLPSGPDDVASSMDIGNVMDYLHNESGSSAMLNQQSLEESYSHEAFNFGDDEEEVAPDPHPTVATVDKVSPPLSPFPQAADSSVAVLQTDLNLLHPDSSVDLTQEDEPLLASSTSSSLGDHLGQGNSNPSEPDLMNDITPQNDSATNAIIFVPNTHHASPASTSAGDDATHMLSTENVHDAVLQIVQDEPTVATTTSSTDKTLICGLDESEPINPLDPHSAGGPESDTTLLQHNSVLVGLDLPDQCLSLPDTRSPSPALSYVDEDLDAATQLSEMPLDDNVPNPSTPADPSILLKQHRLPIISRHCSPATETPSQISSDSLEGSQSESSLTPRLPASEPVAILSASPSGAVSNLLNLLPFSDFPYAPDLKLYNPINDTRFDASEASEGQTYETSQNSNTPNSGADRAMTNPDSPDPLTSNGMHEPTEPCRSSPQPLPSSSTGFLEPTTISSLIGPHSIDADIQSAAASADENLEGPIVDVNSNLSPLVHPDDLARLEVRHDLDSDSASRVDLNEPATSSLVTPPFNPLPLIPVTPPNSPVLGDLYQYITLYDPDVPGAASQENVGVDPDKVSTPVQHEMTAAPHIELLSSTSGDSQSLRSGSSQSAFNSSDPSDKVDITSQPDRRCRYLSNRDPYLGMSNRTFSPFPRMQLGGSNVIPTFFTLDRETINRVISL